MKKTSVIFLLFLFILNSSCDNDDAPSDCGCGSETKNSITETHNITGQINYKTQSEPLDDYYNNLYWIAYSSEGCTNCVTYYIVCNESFLNNEFEDIKFSDEMVDVKFTGNIKSVCEESFQPAGVNIKRIVLTSIEMQ